MKKLFLLLSILLLISASAFAAPMVSTEMLEFDFGEVSQGEKVEYTFRFRNLGDELLEISSVSSSCGCTAALLSAKRIAPGAMGELKATFDSSRFRGRVTKTITMKTNAPAHPEVVFKLHGDVRELLSVSTERISWNWTAAAQNGQAEVKIGNQSQQKILLQTPQVTSPQLQASLDRLELAPGETATLRVTGALAPGEERLNGYVLVATDFQPMPQLRIAVSARLQK